METANISLLVDLVVVSLVLISAYLAMVRGLVRELFALISWAVSFFAAFAFAGSIYPLLAGLPYLDRLAERNCDILIWIAFVVVFGISLIITSLIIWLFSGAIRNTALSFFDQGLGFIYGALRGLVLIAVIYIAYQKIIPEADQFQFVEQAYTIDVVKQAAGVVEDATPDTVPGWLTDRVNALDGQCQG